MQCAWGVNTETCGFYHNKIVNVLIRDNLYNVLAVQHVNAAGWHVVNMVYLIRVSFLGKYVSNESLLHFLLLDQKLPQTLHWQR